MLRKILVLVAALAAVTSALVPATVNAGSTLVVGPGAYESIQDAVDAASPGDTVLVMPGVYQEAVFVTTPDITIEGFDRTSVILDGGGQLNNGIEIANTPGVTVKSMTVQNYNGNGVAFGGSDDWKIIDMHAIDNRVYGLYAIHSLRGELAYSYAEGSGDGGLYVGETPHCDCDVHHNEVFRNVLGYSGTANSYVRIWENHFHNNRAGILMSVLPGEMGVEESGTFYGTQVRSEIYRNNVSFNNDVSVAPQGATETLTPPAGEGIVIAGGWMNTIYDNVLYNNDVWGLGMFWLFTPPRANVFSNNLVVGSEFGLWWDEWGEDNCFEGNDLDGNVKRSDPDPLPDCTAVAGAPLPDCPSMLTDWAACRGSDVRAPSAAKEAALAWSAFIEGGHWRGPLTEL